ncbi:MAG: hypothetical protein Q8933_20080 [Bacteroidota bacterium]|nr:hypothetical protein [Bacteroidota bacterium]
MEKELNKIIKNFEADIKNFRKIINENHDEISKKGLARKISQIEYYASSLKIALKALKVK